MIFEIFGNLSIFYDYLWPYFDCFSHFWLFWPITKSHQNVSKISLICQQNITKISPKCQHCVTEIWPIYHQDFTKISPSYHSHVTNISPICHQNINKMSAKCHQYITNVFAFLCCDMFLQIYAMICWILSRQTFTHFCVGHFPITRETSQLFEIFTRPRATVSQQLFLSLLLGWIDA